MIQKYLGMTFVEAINRFPSYVRGAILQTIASHKRILKYNFILGRPNIVLVPGLFCSPSIFNELGYELNKNANVFVPPPFPYYFSMFSNTGRVDRSANELGKYIKQLANEGIESVSLVGHSLGGIIILKTLQNYFNGNIIPFTGIDNIILMASPIYGSPMARLLKFIPACKDIFPDSNTIKSLDPMLKEIDCTINSGFDSAVPLYYQMLHFNTIDCKFFILDDFQHMDFYIGNKKKIKLTSNIITNVITESNENSIRKYRSKIEQV
jgi:pimeloyl-ACP methyl ester carboxylesterase